jgi:hypothetical protein
MAMDVPEKSVALPRVSLKLSLLRNKLVNLVLKKPIVKMSTDRNV